MGLVLRLSCPVLFLLAAYLFPIIGSWYEVLERKKKRKKMNPHTTASFATLTVLLKQPKNNNCYQEQSFLKYI